MLIQHLYIIRSYDSMMAVQTYLLQSTGNPSWQLKSNLPQLCHIARSFRSVTVTPLNCCSVAACLYVSRSSRPVAQTGREHMSKLRKVNLEREQLQDMSAQKRARSDVSVGAREQIRDMSARKRARSVAYVRNAEQSYDARARRESRKKRGCA